MKKSEIESWAINVIDRVKRGQLVEDSRVELKSDWIEPPKAARRIAGHANAAHGEPILWLIGVDETYGVRGITLNDIADWFNQVKSQFDGISPDSIQINVPYEGRTILAILFETDRAPYVVKNPAGGSIQYEVPWRDGTSIRTANRTELIRILAPIQRLPKLDVLTGKLTVRYSAQDELWHWHIELEIYAATVLRDMVAIPFHQCFAQIELPQILEPTQLIDLTLRPPSLWPGPGGQMINANSPRPQPDSLTIDGTRSELIIQGPGRFSLNGNAETEPIVGKIADSTATFSARLHPIDAENAIPIHVDLDWDGGNLGPMQPDKGRWVIRRNAT